MINSDHSVGNITQRCVSIMRHHWNLFPIAEVIIKEAQTYQEDKKEFIINYHLGRSIGLGYVIQQKANSAAEVWWFTDSKDLDKLSNSIIKSVLSEYTSRFVSKQDSIKWDQMLKEEKLI